MLITCKDRPGIVAAVTGRIFENGGNITSLDQHSIDDLFFMRVQFQSNSHINFDDLAAKFEMSRHIYDVNKKKKVAILVSRYDHALLDILWKSRRDELSADFMCVVGNHKEMEDRLSGFSIPFFFIPYSDEKESENAIADIVKDCDVIVLARFMRILSAGFVNKFKEKIINIHHSFLPAFVGSDPYKKAYERGVKLIGATAHYVTAELDQGPIIEQDVVRVSHRFSIADLRELGRDIECRVLSRALKWHLEDRIIVYGNKTIVFGY